MAKTNKSGTRIYYVPDPIYTDSYEMSPTQRISEVIPWTKQVGVGAPISEEIPWTKQVGVEAPENFEEIPRTKQVGVGAPTEFRRNSTDKASWGWGRQGMNSILV